MRRVLSSHTVLIALLVLISFGSISSIFQAGMFSGHDIWHQVARLHHFSEAINAGQIMPTWVAPLAHGYGYPLFFFSYHLPWMVSMPFIWMGLTVFETLKLVFFIGFLLAGISMYYSLFLVTKSKSAALASSLIYLLSPHHFFSVLVSASIGTVFQFVFVPLIFAFVTVICTRERVSNKYLVLLALAVAASILSHFMSFVFIVPFVGVYGIALIFQRWLAQGKLARGAILQLLGAALLVVGLTAYYVVPMLQLLPFINAAGDDTFSNLYSTNFAYLKQLLYSPWGYSPITSNAKDGEISLQMGVMQWLSIAGAVVFLVISWASPLNSTARTVASKYFALPKQLSTSLIYIVLVLFAGTIFLMLDASEPVWRWVTQFIALDYPFRYLLLGVFFSSFVFGLIVSSVRARSFRAAVLLLGFGVAWYTNRNHMNPNMFTDFSFQTYIDSETTTNTFHEYLPKTANGELLSMPQPVATSSTELTIEPIELTPRGIVVSIAKEKPGEVALHQFDFPGQRAFINGKSVTHSQNSDGLMTVRVAAGPSIVETKYQPTQEYTIALLVSALTLVYCLKVLISTEKINS